MVAILVSKYRCTTLPHSLGARTLGLIAAAIPLQRRRIIVFSSAFRIFLSYKLAKRRAQNSQNLDEEDEIWERTHEENAERVHALMARLEGLWVKLGQYISTRTDVMPRAYVTTLSKLQVHGLP